MWGSALDDLVEPKRIVDMDYLKRQKTAASIYSALFTKNDSGQ